MFYLDGFDDQPAVLPSVCGKLGGLHRHRGWIDEQQVGTGDAVQVLVFDFADRLGGVQRLRRVECNKLPQGFGCYPETEFLCAALRDLYLGLQGVADIPYGNIGNSTAELKGAAGLAQGLYIPEGHLIAREHQPAARLQLDVVHPAFAAVVGATRRRVADDGLHRIAVEVETALQQGVLGVVAYVVELPLEFDHALGKAGIERRAVQAEGKPRNLQGAQRHFRPHEHRAFRDEIGKGKELVVLIFPDVPDLIAVPSFAGAFRFDPLVQQVDFVGFQAGKIVEPLRGVSRCRETGLFHYPLACSTPDFQKVKLLLAVDVFFHGKTPGTRLIVPPVWAFSVKQQVVAGIESAVALARYEHWDFHQVIGLRDSDQLR